MDIKIKDLFKFKEDVLNLDNTAKTKCFNPQPKLKWEFTQEIQDQTWVKGFKITVAKLNSFKETDLKEIKDNRMEHTFKDNLDSNNLRWEGQVEKALGVQVEVNSAVNQAIICRLAVTLWRIKSLNKWLPL